MLRILAPRRENNERTLVDLCEPPKSSNAASVEKRYSTKFVPISAAAAQISDLKPGTKTSVAYQVTESPYPGWDVPHLIKTPWELERHKKRSSWRRSKPEYNFPAHIFKNLPREVYDCIVAQLEHIHLGGDQPCPTCYLSNLYNLSLVSREFEKATSSQMYRTILLMTNDEHEKLPKLKIKGTSRLKLLRRTLRERHALARCVRELHLSDFHALYRDATIDREEIVNLVSSLVMACPYLERLVGFHIPFTHSFDRLSHALSTRPNLKERVWLLSEHDSDFSDEEDSEQGAFYLAASDPTERFLELNASHPMLSALVLHQETHQNSVSLNFRAIVGTFRQLPALRHLSISGLAASSFTNLALNALPLKLQSLRLENLPGVNDRGLQRFFNSQSATSIERLTLIDLEATSLITIFNILSPHLASLKSFSFAQQKAPGLPSTASISTFFAPLLRYLHWEIRSEAGPFSIFPSSSSFDSSEQPSFPFTNPEPICCLATSLLATSIKEGGFPELRKIRIPHDPQGIIQALCRPLATALVPSDISIFTIPPRGCTSDRFSTSLNIDAPASSKAQHQSFGSSRADSAIESPTISGSLVPSALTPARSRLAAQSRIFAARKEAFMTVRVYDPNGDLKINRAVGGFIGSVGTKITYDLRADRERLLRSSMDDTYERNEWITNIQDLTGGSASEQSGLCERSWGSCGHLVGGWIGRHVVRVEEIF